MNISHNTHVSFHYALEGDDGEVLDGSRDGEPLTYIHGHQQIVPGLEQALERRQAGDRFRQAVAAEQGYGARDESRVLELEREAFSGMPGLAIGLYCQIEDEQGELRLGRVVALDTRTVKVDTNHPFAGQDLLFEVEVLAVRTATDEELAAL